MSTQGNGSCMPEASEAATEAAIGASRRVAPYGSFGPCPGRRCARGYRQQVPLAGPPRTERSAACFAAGSAPESEERMAISPIAMAARPPVPWAPLVIAEDRCKGCELCVSACPKDVLALDRSRVNVLGYHPVELIEAGSCTSCAFCARVCPDAVFTVWAAPRGLVREERTR